MNILTISVMARKIKMRYFTNYSFIAFLLGLFLSSGLWVFVQYQIQYDYDATIEVYSRETINLAQAFEEHVRRIVADADKDLLNLKYIYEREGGSSSLIAAYTENARNDPTRNQVSVINEQGTIVASFNKKALATNIADREYFKLQRGAANEELHIGKPIQVRTSGQMTIPLSRRINRPDGTFAGIVYIGIKTEYFSDYYKKINLGNNQLLSLSGTDGFNRARQVNDNLETGQNVMMGTFWERIQSGYTSATYVSTNKLDGITRITSYRVMPDYPLIVSVGKSTQVALVNFERRKQLSIFVASIASLFILVICGLLVNRYTKQQRINMELSRLERLNLVGEMAAGIGHEIRNPLTTVRGYLQWYLKKEKYIELRMPFTTMIEELDRANAIITEYLSLAKDKPIRLKKDNINSALEGLFPLLQAEAYSSGHVLQIDKKDLPDIYMDGNELRQLVLNLVRNGFDAMKTNGTLTIKSYVEKDKVILAVRDTGIGIPESIIDKLGIPFLTTKDSGTGLGLAVCYQIAKRHEAEIDVETSSDGTIFYVKFEIGYSN